MSIYKMVQDSTVKTQLTSCVSTVLSCTILLYLTQRGCCNLRVSIYGAHPLSDGQKNEENERVLVEGVAGVKVES